MQHLDQQDSLTVWISTRLIPLICPIDKYVWSRWNVATLELDTENIGDIRWHHWHTETLWPGTGWWNFPWAYS
jgi:hypothetical protein